MGDDHQHGHRGGPVSGRRPAAGSSVLTPPTGMSLVPDDRLVAPTTGAAAPSAVSWCRCGHDPDAHRHWRRGSDCGQCGVGECTAYRPRGGALRRLRQGMGLFPRTS